VASSPSPRPARLRKSGVISLVACSLGQPPLWFTKKKISPSKKMTQKLFQSSELCHAFSPVFSLHCHSKQVFSHEQPAQGNQAG
jgi:hypothetical protein